MTTSASERESLRWVQVEGFFREHGCVIVDTPELGWYRESWGALEKAGLTGAAESEEVGFDRTVPRLRAVCLLAMYLGIYQAAGNFSELGGYFSEHVPLSRYLDSLNVDTEDLWELARRMGTLETVAESLDEDEDVDDERLYELAMELVEGETNAIFTTLVDHYGGETELFVSLWRSRNASDEKELLNDIVNTVRFGDGKLDVHAYVEEGMMGWWWE